jgi:hypothetical protein
MTTSMLRWTCALTLITGLAGCGGQQPTAGGFFPGGADAAQAARSEAGRSWMSPDAKGKDLVYVTDESANDVDVFSYPRLKHEGTLTGFDGPFGECVDGHGDVFIANDDATQIFEYAHGGTSPIATLNDPGYYPRGCSIDPTTGNLAVVNIASTSLGQGNIAIYTNATGTPSAYYSDTNIYYPYAAGYDNSGNLYIDGENDGSTAFAFGELPSGAKTITDVSLNQSIAIPGAVQWDGKYVAIGDEYSYIYQFSIQGTKGTLAGTTTLNGTGRNSEYWIEGPKVIVPYDVTTGPGRVGIWKYPAGGSATRSAKGFEYSIGATVSKAK